MEKLYSSKILLKMIGGGMHLPTPSKYALGHNFTVNYDLSHMKLMKQN